MAAPSRVAARQAQAAEALNEKIEEMAAALKKMQKQLAEVTAKLDELLGAAPATSKKASGKS